MITPEKIDEWIREVEERPSSASTIIRYISNRLSDLSSRNEELLAENISLLTGKKIEDYESRIANLEYQVELLKRQLGGELALPEGVLNQAPAINTISFLLYSPQGWVLRVESGLAELASGGTVGRFEGEVTPEGRLPRLLAAGPQEELLFIFDTGRTATMAVSALKAASLDWKQAFVQEPRGMEELAAILPIAKMALYESCIQTSRKGFIKKIKEPQFEAYIANSYIGTGVKLPLDKTCGLAFCGKDDWLVIASKEGFLLGLEANRLPITIEEAMKLGTTDHIITGFSASPAEPAGAGGGKSKAERPQPSLLVVTQNGKVLQRDLSWLEIASTFKTRGQPIFSKERRATGARLVGAAAVLEEDWGVALHADGGLTTHRVKDLVAAGSIFAGKQAGEILDFTTFRLPPARTTVKSAKGA